MLRSVALDSGFVPQARYSVAVRGTPAISDGAAIRGVAYCLSFSATKRRGHVMAKETGKAIYSAAFKEAGLKLVQQNPEFASPTSDNAIPARQGLVLMYAVSTLYEAQGIESSDKVWLGRQEKLKKALESAVAKVSKAADALSARTVQLGLRN